MQKANPEIEDKLKKYKRGQSMGDMKKVKFRKNKQGQDNKQQDDDEYDESPRAKSIHIIMRPDEDEEVRKISEIEKKNMKKQFMNIFNEFPEDEAGFEDSEAAKLAA
jgi:hypothetical protein